MNDSPVYMFEWSPYTDRDRFHTHNHLEIGFCLRGRGLFHFGDKTYEAGPGDLFVVNGLEQHAASSDAAEPSTYYFLYFEELLIEQLDPSLLIPFVYKPKAFDNRIPAACPTAVKVGSLLREIWSEYRSREIGYEGMVKSKLAEICTLLLRYYKSRLGAEAFDHAVSGYFRLKKALDFIKERFRDDIALADVAAELALSPSRLRHLFKENMGCGFKSYLLLQRIQEAKKLLTTTGLPILDICMQCGFQTSAPFYRAFKQLVGLSPAEYRHLPKVSPF